MSNYNENESTTDILVGPRYIRRVKKVTIHSDGACQGNPGPGGWAAVLQYGANRRELSGSALATTNNRMEIQAALEALRALKEPCEVELFTDSEYLRAGITEWVRGWKFKGWQTKDKQPVKNKDLWQELDAIASRHKITWRWLKGHAGHALNERCDQLAVAEIQKLRSRHKREDLAQALTLFKRQQAENGHSAVAQNSSSRGSAPSPARLSPNAQEWG